MSELHLTGNRARHYLGASCHEFASSKLTPGIPLADRFDSGFPEVIIELYVAHLITLADRKVLRFIGNNGPIDHWLQTWLKSFTIKALTKMVLRERITYAPETLVTLILEELSALKRYERPFVQAA